MNAFHLAIDPGANGGFAVRNPERTWTLPMPKSETQVIEEIDTIRNSAGRSGCELQVIVEKVGGYIGRGQPGSSMFKFGRGVGVIVGALVAMQIPFREVTPQQWQKAAGAGTTNGRTPTEWKRHLRDLAAKRHPNLKPTLSTADALLMLESFL